MQQRTDNTVDDWEGAVADVDLEATGGGGGQK